MIKYSIIISSRNRLNELIETLNRIYQCSNTIQFEVLVFFDGCDFSGELTNEEKYYNLKIFSSKSKIGPSIARHLLIENSEGKYIIGFDDDSEPVNHDYLKIIDEIFSATPNIGIISFKEIRDLSKENDLNKNVTEFYTNEFVGCGFALRKSAYKKTKGFPKWMTYYGEEACVSAEFINAGYDIFFTSKIQVLHRLNRAERGKLNMIRFENQLTNTFFYYIVYHSFPFVKVIKLLWHNSIKYAIKNPDYFTHYLKALKNIVFRFSKIVQYRSPLKESTWKKIKMVRSVDYR